MKTKRAVLVLASLAFVACTAASGTQVDSMTAAEHREHARSHESRAAPDVALGRAHAAAARELERFEEAECTKFEPLMRSECPFWYGVAEVEDIPGGALLRLRPGISADAVLEHMRCHHAFGRARGFSNMPACPLYLRGIELRPQGDHAVAIVGGDPSNVDAIRTRSRSHLSRPKQEGTPSRGSSESGAPYAPFGVGGP